MSGEELANDGSSGLRGADLLEELREARLEIVRLRNLGAVAWNENQILTERLKVAVAQGERDHQQIRHMRRSLSWRVTYPLRVFRRSVKDSVPAIPVRNR